MKLCNVHLVVIFKVLEPLDAPFESYGGFCPCFFISSQNLKSKQPKSSKRRGELDTSITGRFQSLFLTLFHCL